MHKVGDSAPHPGGSVASGFEEVRAEFDRNFLERGEIGAAVAAYWRGEKVVDLWGGRRAPDGDPPWNEETMIVVNSTTKGLAAMTIAVASSRGWIDYEAPVAEYWPEFAENGKAAVTVRQLLSHEAGLVWIDEPLHVEDLHDLDKVSRALARQKPAWEPGTRHGYHAMTIGLYMQELIRHVDPEHRTLGRFFHEEIATRLGIDFYIGLPPEIPDERLAKLRTFTPMRSIRALPRTPKGFVIRILWPRSLLRKSMLFADLDFNDRRFLEVEIPAGNGVGTARAIGARILGLRGGRSGARHHSGDPHGYHGYPRGRASAGRGDGRAELDVARLPQARSAARLRYEPARVRHARRRWLVRLRRPRLAPRLRLRDEQHGLLHGRRSSRESTARCCASLYQAALRLRVPPGAWMCPASGAEKQRSAPNRPPPPLGLLRGFVLDVAPASRKPALFRSWRVRRRGGVQTTNCPATISYGVAEKAVG
jgi:CubicO group peptidase (beta-lactamase class C family)